jgi:hypothetical protein
MSIADPSPAPKSAKGVDATSGTFFLDKEFVKKSLTWLTKSIAFEGGRAKVTASSSCVVLSLRRFDRWRSISWSESTC